MTSVMQVETIKCPNCGAAIDPEISPGLGGDADLLLA
jgi:hypothetical protein